MDQRTSKSGDQGPEDQADQRTSGPGDQEDQEDFFYQVMFFFLLDIFFY